MQTIDIKGAKTQLSRLVDLAAAGEEIVITRAGKPVARLVPLEATKPHAPRSGDRVLGALAGQFTVPDDFDAPLPDDLLALFEGR